MLGEARYLDAAVAAAEFVWERMRDGDGRLLRSYNDGAARLARLPRGSRVPARGAADALRGDLRRALLRLGARARRRDPARASPTRERGGFFVTAADGEPLIARRKDLEDHPIPSGSSSAALGLLRLAALSGESAYEEAALGAIALAARARAALSRWPSGTCSARSICTLAGAREVALVGRGSGAAARGRARAPPPPPRARRGARAPARRAVALLKRAARRRSADRLRLRALRCQAPVTDPQALRHAA